MNVQAPNCILAAPDGGITCDAVPTTNTTKGTAVFDGAGGVVLNLAQRRIDRGGLTTSTISGAGSYTVAADCSAVITTPTGESALFTTVASGNFIYEADPPGGLMPHENFVGMALRD